ncbi:MAG: hypothetical protein JSS66_02715 [Armatimonadetes bacterium]|nr:hypothetical protein [Armatimonadota bacterium]
MRIAILLCALAASRFAMSDPLLELDACNVVWMTPSQGAEGSMPIGNGAVGANVWVEPNGDIVLLLSRTDAWSEACRLLKVGRVRVHFEPNPFAHQLRQELVLRDGRIRLTAAGTDLSVFVEDGPAVVRLVGTKPAKTKMTVTVECWRDKEKRLTGGELDSSWTMRGAPDSVNVSESADVFPKPKGDALVWYHRNESSIVPFTLKHQGIEQFAGLVKDPLLHRTFGGWVEGPGLRRSAERELRDEGGREVDLRILTPCSQRESAQKWLAVTEDWARQAKSGKKALEKTREHWNGYWRQSWIWVSGFPQARRINQSYALQKWMTACASGGTYPIKFNGSIFTVEPKADGQPYDPDWRRWGDCFWWQNTRFPYAAMPARGEYGEMHGLYKMFEDALPLCKARAKAYYGADGVYFPETITAFGTYSNGDYGWNRDGKKASDVDCPWWMFAWQQGLELVSLMLDEYEGTESRLFLDQHLLPMAREVLSYYHARFLQADGKLKISPTQAVETYWHGVVDDTPSVAGLWAVTERLLAIKGLPEKDRQAWSDLRSSLTPVPVTADHKRIAPAREFNPDRSNVENPELYAIWPFRVYGVGRQNLAVARETFKGRIEKANMGWQYDGQTAAIAGLAQEAMESLLAKVANSNKSHRFPAIWGPNYDWLPDQCHGSNIMLTLQNMAFQCDRDKIFVLPAWPAAWDVSFKFHAAKQTTVEVTYRKGQLVSVIVSPESRRKDLVVMPTQ